MYAPLLSLRFHFVSTLNIAQVNIFYRLNHLKGYHKREVLYFDIAIIPRVKVK